METHYILKFAGKRHVAVCRPSVEWELRCSQHNVFKFISRIALSSHRKSVFYKKGNNKTFSIDQSEYEMFHGKLYHWEQSPAVARYYNIVIRSSYTLNASSIITTPVKQSIKQIHLLHLQPPFFDRHSYRALKQQRQQ